MFRIVLTNKNNIIIFKTLKVITKDKKCLVTKKVQNIHLVFNHILNCIICDSTASVWQIHSCWKHGAGQPNRCSNGRDLPR